MRVTLLGTGSADGWPNPFCACASCTAERKAGRTRRPSSALIDATVLIDCGPTTPHLPARLDLTAVEHVLVTHGHPDHLHPAFLLTRGWTSTTMPLHVWGPALAIDQCRDWIGPDSPVELHVLEPGDTVALATQRGDYSVHALPAAHAHGDGDTIAAEALIYVVQDAEDRRLLYATDTGPLPASTIALLPAAIDVVVIDETFGDHADHGTGHLDLARLPGLLDALRIQGSVTPETTIIATHLSHHNPPTATLQQRLAPLGVNVIDDLTTIDTARPGRGVTRRHLVLGGARSGKSTFAERLLASASHVTYVATGGTRPDDGEWQVRVDAHRARRPQSWATVETTDVAAVLASAPRGSSVLVDCLALWLTAQLDDIDAWRRADAGDSAEVMRDAEGFIGALELTVDACAAEVVLVSNEVGMGVVPATSSGRLFRDLLGIVNARMARACTQTTLVVAGRPLTLESTDDH